MKNQRKGIVSALRRTAFVPTVAICAFWTAAAGEVSRICAVGGTEKFRAFLAEAAGTKSPVEIFDAVCGMPFATATNTLFVIAPRGAAARPSFSAETIAAMAASAARGNRFYFECVRSDSPEAEKFLGVRTFGSAMAPMERKVIETEPGLLQWRVGGFMPSALRMAGKVKQRAKTVASVSDALGVNAIFLPPTERCPAVAVSADGMCMVSMLSLSDCDVKLLHPYSRGKTFFAQLFGRFLKRDEKTVGTAFGNVWPDFLFDSPRRPAREVVEKAVSWHEKSGVLFAPDGSLGMREAVSSDGFQWRKELRVDCHLMTAALFARAGKECGRADWIRTGRNLADFILARDNQTEHGYFRWFDAKGPSYPPHFVYATDHGRSTLAVINLYLATGEKRYLDVARKAADAFLAWQADDGLVTICFDLRKTPTPKHGHSLNPVCYYENIPALFKMAEITGERKYSDAALLCVNTLASKFPDFNLGKGAFYSANSVYGRFLLAAASAMRATDADYSKQINGVLDFYEENQHRRGGISEIKIRLIAHEEAGVGIGDGSDHIADLLYCNNFSFAALSLLMKLPAEKVKGIDMAKARRVYAKLRDFLAESQITSPDPKFDGAWMRAYDMDLGERHGLDKDAGWGPYCIETGWTTGTIPLVFLFDGSEDSYF